MPIATLKCCGCKERFDRTIETAYRSPTNSWFHSSECAASYAMVKSIKQKQKKAKARMNKMRAEVKGLGHWKHQTQKVINGYVRARDKGKSCISCDKLEGDLSTDALHGSVWDAGHYRSVGSEPSLRFDLRNINGQCRNCNGYRGGRKLDQQPHIIERYGHSRLDWLDGNHEAKHYTIEQLARMRKVIRKRARKHYGLKL